LFGGKDLVITETIESMTTHLDQQWLARELAEGIKERVRGFSVK
jgi:hypothetical protein